VRYGGGQGTAPNYGTRCLSDADSQTRDGERDRRVNPTILRLNSRTWVELVRRRVFYRIPWIGKQKRDDSKEQAGLPSSC